MKKTKKTFRLGALLLIVCLISTVMLSGTFAKYTSEYAGRDTALVARWSFTAEGGDGNTPLGTTAVPVELKLFDHLYDSHINQKYGTGVNEQFIIAPGVGDEFTLKMNYIADVDADVLISITGLEGNAGVPMEYSADNGSTWVTLALLPDEIAKNIVAKTAIATTVTGSDDTSGKLTDATNNDKTFSIAAVANDSVTPVSISQTVKWRWAYDADAQTGISTIASNNETDTGLGEDSQDAVADDDNDITKRTTYGINIDLKATQVTPTTE